ncbi:MAG: ABC transporter ATP-binding protein, partial [Candidatus Acidiferrum sp.]
VYGGANLGARQPMNYVIHTDTLTKKFRRVNALNGLDLSVPASAVYAFVGPNGAGKTTAIKILMNIIRPTAGRASVLGVDSARIAGRAFASIGYASENQQLPGWMRVGTFLAYLRPFYPTWDIELEAQLVKSFELPVDRKLRHLSRGMRMKAALASALALRPKLIVLDEPFSGLDPLVRDQLSQALLQRSPETTIFISSHDLAEVEGLATHVGYLEAGCLRFSEEMASLSARFREVEVVFENSAILPQDLPATWLQIAVSPIVLRFVDSAFDQNHSTAEIARRFGSVRNVTFTPMPLRAIFLTMARTPLATKEKPQ